MEDGDSRLYIGERRKPKNLNDIRSFRSAMRDPANKARMTKVNNVTEEEAEKDRTSNMHPR